LELRPLEVTALFRPPQMNIHSLLLHFIFFQTVKKGLDFITSIYQYIMLFGGWTQINYIYVVYIKIISFWDLSSLP